MVTPPLRPARLRIARPLVALLLGLAACAPSGGGRPVPTEPPAVPGAQDRRDAARLRQEAKRALAPPPGQSRDTERAALLLDAAARRGDAEAQMLLALGHLAPGSRDAAAALPWLHRAAQQGHADAQYRLGQLIEAGEGTRREPAWAAVWIHRAAERGHAPAHFAMALLQIAAEGTARDEAEALARLAIAERAGIATASRYAEALRRRVPPSAARAAAARLRGETARGPVAAVDRPLVRFAQSALAALGQWNRAVDGRDAPATREALQAFARGQGLAATAPYDTATLDRLRAAVRPR